MNTPNRGRTVWFALLGLGLLYEVYTLVNRRKGDTLSEVVWSATDATPMTPLAVGVVVGHWFWGRKVQK